MDKRKVSIPWYEEYPHLSILILSSTNLPRDLQVCIGENLLATTNHYIYYLQKYLGRTKLAVRPMWSFYLSHKQQERWFDASPKLHEAYGLITVLPPQILTHLDARTDGLVNYLCMQLITCSINILDSKIYIQNSLNLELEDLLELLHPDEAYPMSSLTESFEPGRALMNAS